MTWDRIFQQGSDPGKPRTRPKILVVEDAATIRELLVETLGEESWDVVTAIDGLDGILAAFSEDPDLIISDVVMPGVTGYHLCRFLKGTDQHRTIPIILLTTQDKPLDQFWGQHSAADRYLLKSEDMDPLVQTCRELLAESRSRSRPVARSPMRLTRSQVSEQMASMLDRLLLESTLKEEVARLGHIPGSITALLGAAVDLVSRVITAEQVAVMLRMKDGSVLVATRSIRSEDREPVLRRLLSAMDPALTLPPVSGRTWITDAGSGFPSLPAAASAMIHPLRKGDQTFGAIGLFRSAGDNFASTDEKLFQLLLSEFSAIAAIAWSREMIHRMNQELVELNTMKERLAELLVHDMKNTIWSVTMGLDMLAANKEVTGSVRRVVTDVRSASHVLVEMMLNLLDVAKMEEAHVLVKAADISLSRVASEALSVHQALAERRGLEMSLAALPDAHADPDLVRRVFSNLLGNAVRYTPRGRVSVEGGPVPCADGEPSMVSVTVRDTGVGISRDFLPSLFQKYSRSEQFDKSGPIHHRPIDRGLGLYFCRLAVEAHGGTISVESEPDKGSAFTITLPADRSSFQARAARKKGAID